jgi:hypothetical protein
MSKAERVAWVAMGITMSIIGSIFQTQFVDRILCQVAAVIFLTMGITGRPKH